jgi:hypothetical protein
LDASIAFTGLEGPPVLLFSVTAVVDTIRSSERHP